MNVSFNDNRYETTNRVATLKLHPLERLRKNASFNEADRNTFYMVDEKGYLDYPLL